MWQDHLQPRPLYGIGTVARLTGVKPDTLRVWERRYKLGASYKSASGRRQYTQSDLEHLQIVSALVASGTRIGEIASAGRRTLEALLRTRVPAEPLPESKPRSVFVGEGLCRWLDEHQGCLAGVDASLAWVDLEQLEPEMFDGIGEVSSLVLECVTPGRMQLERIEFFTSLLGPEKVLILCHAESARWSKELAGLGHDSAPFPPDPAFLACHLAQVATSREIGIGEVDMGELVADRPQLFSEEQLLQVRNLSTSLDSECRLHLTDLIRDLTHFQAHSASRSVDNWADAALQSSVYAYTRQARYLMERALCTVLDRDRTEPSLLNCDEC